MIYISSYWWMNANAENLAPRSMVSIMDPGVKVSPPNGLQLDNHLCLQMHDISNVDKMSANEVAPNGDEIKTFIDFGKTWSPYTPVLFHCMAGVSRSTAAALTLLLLKNPGKETKAVNALRDAAPHAQPNSLFIDIADDLLGLKGSLSSALRAMPRPILTPPEGVVELSPFL
jgi:predicted protein tyrosine phosphatase